jgi:hypothetical protein
VGTTPGTPGYTSFVRLRSSGGGRWEDFDALKLYELAAEKGGLDDPARDDEQKVGAGGRIGGE